MSASNLSQIQRQILDISERAEAVARRVGPHLLAVRPRPDTWSIAECLIHLRITVERYMPIWQKAVADALAVRSTAHPAPFKLDFWGRFFVWFLEPPPKVRFRAPRQFRPELLPGDGEGALADFLTSQDLVLKLIRDAAELPVDRMIIRSAFGSFFRYSFWSSLCTNAAHHRRHIWQAERVAEVLLAAGKK